jgi:aspartate aminotransferase
MCYTAGMKRGKQHIYELPFSDITGLAAVAQQMQLEAQSRGEILPPAVRLQIGEPSFRTPEHICQAAVASLEGELQTYAPAQGWLWLRELLAAKITSVNAFSVEPQHIAVSMGGTGALYATLLATVGAGDEVLVPDPCWPHYRVQVACSGAAALPYPLDPQRAWLPQMEQLERLVTRRTRLMIINSPANPSGAVLPASYVADLLAFAQRHDLYLLSDECYDELVFEGRHVSPASLLSRDEFELGRVICIYSFSKIYAMTGWRIGYLATGVQLLKTITEVLSASTNNVSTMAQRAAAAAVSGPQECVAEMRESYRRRRDLALGLLKELGRYFYTPHGAFYVLIDVSDPHRLERRGRQFALDLLRERNVAVAHGSVFGEVSQAYVRISLAASDGEIERGVREICAFAGG